MSEIEELYENFPTILKEKLRNKEIEFPSNTKFDYEKIYVYRAVSREITDFHEIDKNDFRSYFELGKKPKKLVKGRSLKNDAHWYGVSTFTNKEIIEFNMKFPNPHKKMAAGYVHCEGGPQETKDEHVCWWLYKDVDLSSFRIMEDKMCIRDRCYTGGIYDQSTGLYYLNARYYNPEDGRFMTEDSYRGEIMKPEIGHLYVYCANNPVNYVDPSGHFAIAVPVLVKLVLVGGTVIYVSYSTWKDHSPKTRYDGRRISYRSTIFRWIVAKAIRHGIKKYAEHTTNQTKANKQKHQKANARRQREQGGDKKRNKKGWKSRK